MANQRKTNRRAFLQGRAAAHAVADAVDQLLGEPQPLPELQREGYLLRLTRQAMACQFEMVLNAGQYPAGAEAACAALDLVDRLEDQLSVFRDTSEISHINQQASAETVNVESRLAELLALALDLSHQTQGAFDITAGPLARAWGFVRRQGTLPDEQTLVAVRECVGSQHLDLDRQQGTIRFLRRGMEINLGSIGKGYALDRCAEVFAEASIEDYLLHGGSSSILARGGCLEQGSDGAWMVGLRNPHQPEQRIGQIRLRNRALATSGSGTQFFMHQGQRYGHILDPRTGWPADRVLSATAIAPTAAEADALSTAFYVLGPEDTAAYCAAHPGIGSILICQAKQGAGLDVLTAGLEQGDFAQL